MEPNDHARPLFFGGLVAAIAAALIGLLGPHDGSVWRLPQVLEARVERALDAAGAGGLEVEMQGQAAQLMGVAATPQAIAAAQRAALGAAGDGGPWAGGVTRVEASRVTIGPPERPFTWRLAKTSDGRVVLSGAAPSAAARQALVVDATASFPNGRVLDRMHVAGGAPSAAWRRVAQDAMHQVAKLTRGQARLNDATLVIVGDGERAAVEAVRAHYATPQPAPYRVRADVSVTGEPLAIPELADLDLSDARADTCGQAFDRLMAHNVITFESGSAALDPASLPLLDDLASVALRCDQFQIDIEGHTDNAGEREANLALSQQRAATVAGYLESLNVARDRLRAIGYGPDRPAASNDTPAGQAANRRIVFSVRT